METARSEGGHGNPAAKLRQYVIEASKQCQRNRLMEITPPIAWAELMHESGKRKIVAHPGGRPWGEQTLPAAADTMLAVGPEGGLTNEEIAQAVEADWMIVAMGKRILRVETAALALIARLTVE